MPNIARLFVDDSTIAAIAVGDRTLSDDVANNSNIAPGSPSGAGVRVEHERSTGRQY